MKPSPHLYILDAIGPFFRSAPAGRINWSKIPFSALEENGRVRRPLFEQIREDFDTVCRRAAEYGFTAVSIDDLAHLYDHPAYHADQRTRIQEYQAEFSLLFGIAASHGLAVYVTTDIMFFNATLEVAVGHDRSRQQDFMAHAIGDVFSRFPNIAGIISRIGESDGVDVKGDFHSRLTIRSPRQARSWVKALLPVFERHNRQWIFRTWSVGAYRIGDLIWNRDTLRKVFGGIRSRHLTLSMKHGESDFFRYLPVNKQFFRGGLSRIVEVQARREYEGAGQYPSFIGPEVERFREVLREIPTVAGSMVWCQTGGWTRFRRLSFLDNDAVWNEINTWVAIRVLKDGVTSKAAVESWRARYAPHLDGEQLYRLLMISSEVVTNLLYIDEFARRKVFFRRLRIPPLLSVFWDHVIINHSMRQIMRCFVSHGEAAVQRGKDALARIDEMIELSRRLDLRPEDFVFMRDSYEILAAAREYYFRDFTSDTANRIRSLDGKYREKYPDGYTFHINFNPVRVKTARLRWILKILLREKRGYRFTDRIFTIHILGIVYPTLRRINPGLLPDFSRKQAMGIDTIFK